MKILIGCMLLSFVNVLGQILDQKCINEDMVLYHFEEMPEAFDSMMRKYNETCTPEQCKMQPEDNLVGILKWDYGGSNFALDTTCESFWNRGYKTCEVSTVAYHTFKRSGIDIDGYVLERNKPVCFPPTCADSQVSILDPYPGKCNPDELDCKIIHYSVNCPDREVEADTEKCEDDALPDISPFFVTRGVTEVAIIADCVSLLSFSGSSGLCSASTGPVNSSTFSNFTDFKEDPTYIEHEEACLAQGGQVCHFDMIADYTIHEEDIKGVLTDVLPLEQAGDIHLSHRFIDFPRCISPQCDDPELMPFVLERHAEVFLRKFGLRCDLESDDCNLEIQDARCPFYEPEIPDVLMPFEETVGSFLRPVQSKTSPEP